MPQRSKQAANSRQTPRLKLPPMYTLIRVRPKGTKRFCWTGHIYDISAAGMRFELDAPLEPGTFIEIRAMLPGSQQTTISVSGHIVRYHDDSDERGPIRLGMIFDAFTNPADRARLIDYLHNSGIKQAA